MSDAGAGGERRRRREQERRADGGQAAPRSPSTSSRPLSPPSTAKPPSPPSTAKPPALPPATRRGRRAAGAPGSPPTADPGTAGRAPVDEPPADEPTTDRATTETAAGRSAAPAPGVAPSTLPRAPERRRPRTAVLALAAGAALLAVVLLVALVTRLAGGPGDDGEPEATGGPATQRTLLVVLADGSGVVGAALTGTDGERTAAVLVPSRLVVDVAGSGRVPLADALRVGDAAPARAVADALGVRVDGSWVLTADGLAALVDALGGIVVDVDTEVTAGDVVVPAGPDRRLDGEAAAALATALEPDEAETARLARQDAVLTAVLAALPSDPGDLADRLAALGEDSRTTGGSALEVLAAAADDAAAGDYAATVLPVRDLATGGDEPLAGVDDAAAAQVLQRRLPGALAAGGDTPRVLVQNGVGEPGLGERARDLLVAAGLRYVGGGNAATFGREETVVAIPSDSDRDRERGLAVAEALGLGPGAVAVGREAPTLADVVVVLGQDFADATRPT